MAFELVYTSVPRGIRPGSSGFCIVAYTNGLAANLALQLESMSAYKPCFPHYDANAARNPVAYSHGLFRSSGEEVHILSRVCFYGLDYTKRSNKLAHHVVVRPGETAGAAAGPAAVFRQPGLFRTEWNSEPQLFPQQQTISAPETPFRKADAWAAYAGDAGWAGVLAQRWLDSPDRPAFIIFDPLKHGDTLQLVDEALQLLPPKRRWEVSFSTYFMRLPAGIRCSWRFCVPDSDALKEARRLPGTLVIDLTRPLPPAPAGALQEAARSGISPYRKAERKTEAPPQPRQPEVVAPPSAAVPPKPMPPEPFPGIASAQNTPEPLPQPEAVPEWSLLDSPWENEAPQTGKPANARRRMSFLRYALVSAAALLLIGLVIFLGRGATRLWKAIQDSKGEPAAEVNVSNDAREPATENSDRGVTSPSGPPRDSSGLPRQPESGSGAAEGTKNLQSGPKQTEKTEKSGTPERGKGTKTEMPDPEQAEFSPDELKKTMVPVPREQSTQMDKTYAPEAEQRWGELINQALKTSWKDAYQILHDEKMPEDLRKNSSTLRQLALKIEQKAEAEEAPQLDADLKKDPPDLAQAQAQLASLLDKFPESSRFKKLKEQLERQQQKAEVAADPDKRMETNQRMLWASWREPEPGESFTTPELLLKDEKVVKVKIRNANGSVQECEWKEDGFVSIAEEGVEPVREKSTTDGFFKTLNLETGSESVSEKSAPHPRKLYKMEQNGNRLTVTRLNDKSSIGESPEGNNPRPGDYRIEEFILNKGRKRISTIWQREWCDWPKGELMMSVRFDGSLQFRYTMNDSITREAMNRNSELFDNLYIQFEGKEKSGKLQKEGKEWVAVAPEWKPDDLDNIETAIKKLRDSLTYRKMQSQIEKEYPRKEDAFRTTYSEFLPDQSRKKSPHRDNGQLSSLDEFRGNMGSRKMKLEREMEELKKAPDQKSRLEEKETALAKIKKGLEALSSLEEYHKIWNGRTKLGKKDGPDVSWEKCLDLLPDSRGSIEAEWSQIQKKTGVQINWKTLSVKKTPELGTRNVPGKTKEDKLAETIRKTPAQLLFSLDGKDAVLVEKLNVKVTRQ